MDCVRGAERLWFDGDPMGNRAADSVVDSFKINLEEYLASEGYAPVPYHTGNQPEAIGYAKRPCLLRDEPVLIDDGGTVIQSTGLRVLKVAVRDAEGKNKPLHDRIVEMLRPVCGGEPVEWTELKPAKGTKVYEIERVPY